MFQSGAKEREKRMNQKLTDLEHVKIHFKRKRGGEEEGIGTLTGASLLMQQQGTFLMVFRDLRVPC